jgi:hypothetical protein
MASLRVLTEAQSRTQKAFSCFHWRREKRTLTSAPRRLARLLSSFLADSQTLVFLRYASSPNRTGRSLRRPGRPANQTADFDNAQRQ